MKMFLCFIVLFILGFDDSSSQGDVNSIRKLTKQVKKLQETNEALVSELENVFKQTNLTGTMPMWMRKSINKHTDLIVNIGKANLTSQQLSSLFPTSITNSCGIFDGFTCVTTLGPVLAQCVTTGVSVDGLADCAENLLGAGSSCFGCIEYVISILF